MKNGKTHAKKEHRCSTNPGQALGRRLPPAVVSFAATDLQHISISISTSTSTSTDASPRGTGRQDSIVSSGLQSAISRYLRSNHESCLCRVADAQAVSQHTRPHSGPQRPGMAGLHGQHPALWWGVACRGRRFEMKNCARSPAPSFLSLCAPTATPDDRHPSSTRQCRLELFLVS
jgi:hypothetical protein